ncbi:MAG: hypothetical protein BZY88_16360, partial [SAR202 cluster bacterium Io17-Chloro-G9]
MKDLIWPKNKRLSYKDESAKLIQTMNPLDFLSAEANGPSSRDAFSQLHSVIHAALEEVETSIELVFEQLGAEGPVADRVITEASENIRNEMVRAGIAADQKKEALIRDIHNKLENVYIQGVIAGLYQEPSVRRWVNLSAHAFQRDLPDIADYSRKEMARAEDRGKNLPRWRQQVDEWLEAMCRNHVTDVIRAMEEEIKDFLISWSEMVSSSRRRATAGGGLFESVVDPDLWSFESEDPTVRNLLRGTQAQDIAYRILDRFQLSGRDLNQVSEMVRASLEGTRVYGTERVGVTELEDSLARALAIMIHDSVAVESGFLSVISDGVRFQEELVELMVDMQRGTSAMEQKVWRVGEEGVGHVDSASAVGITASHVHDMASRGLGGGRKFAVVEAHPGDNQRFNLQMSMVGAPTADLTIFRDMVAAWHAWHFEEERGACKTESEWLELVNSDSWKLYPDIGGDAGVRNAIIELIGEDLTAMWSSGERMETHSSNGRPSDQD